MTIEEEEEGELRIWGDAEVRMFHNLKAAKLIQPWNALTDRAMQLAARSWDDEEVDAQYLIDFCVHLEILALEAIEDRRKAFHSDYTDRTGYRG